jgi:hypothetical protein
MDRGDICGDNVLQILIDKSGRSFEELCIDFGVPSNSAGGGLMEMYYCLMALNEVADSSCKCNEWSFEEYFIRRLIAERLARTVVETFHYSIELLLSDL